MPMERWSLPDEVVVTDVCLSGRGASFDTKHEYFHAEFPVEIKKLNLIINALELLTVAIAAKVLGEEVVWNANYDKMWKWDLSDSTEQWQCI